MASLLKRAGQLKSWNEDKFLRWQALNETNRIRVEESPLRNLHEVIFQGFNTDLVGIIV